MIIFYNVYMYFWPFIVVFLRATGCLAAERAQNSTYQILSHQRGKKAPASHALLWHDRACSCEGVQVSPRGKEHSKPCILLRIVATNQIMSGKKLLGMN
jgi:hypothetical protein